MKKGWIYALYSEQCPFIKIGLTTTSPAQRISEINKSSNYGPLGPWFQLDIRQVKDVRAIESSLHRTHRAASATNIPGTKELFRLSPQEARAALDSIPEADLYAPTPINQLNLESDFVSYLLALFRNSGLINFRDLQESWTFSLFPGTSGGRYFTLNIDRHEVAFSRPLSTQNNRFHHRIVVDQMAKKDRELKAWLKPFDGRIQSVNYASNWGNAVSVDFTSTFHEGLGLFNSAGFRRALIAYWYEALLRMQEREARSLFARHHDYDATSEVFRHLRETRSFRRIL